jgi:acetate kinase
MKPAILTLNAGSSSIKFAVFTLEDHCNLLYTGRIELSIKQSVLLIFNSQQNKIQEQIIPSVDYVFLFQKIVQWVNTVVRLHGVGHRVVHGGLYFKQATVITKSIIKQIKQLIPLAPLHQAHNLAAIKMLAKHYPQVPQCACFDTSFHLTQKPLAKLFGLPKALTSAGIIRYGFHGLSYEYIASVLPQYIGTMGAKKIIVLHLGSGASICAMENYKSVACSMGFTVIDGLIMNTRCGTLDPGVILYLLQEKKYTVPQLQQLLYYDSGLLGVSNGISSDIRQLINNKDPDAAKAVELFCYRAACEIGRLSISLGGCNALVFTAGIGEHIAFIRQKICAYLDFWQLKLDLNQNQANTAIISAPQSSILVSVIPTNEESIIAIHTKNLLFNKPKITA